MPSPSQGGPETVPSAPLTLAPLSHAILLAESTPLPSCKVPDLLPITQAFGHHFHPVLQDLCHPPNQASTPQPDIGRPIIMMRLPTTTFPSRLSTHWEHPRMFHLSNGGLPSPYLHLVKSFLIPPSLSASTSARAVLFTLCYMLVSLGET